MNRKMLFVFWLLFVLATTVLAQVTKVCSDRPSTTYIYVNGIWNSKSDADLNRTKLENEFRFATSSTLSSPSLDDCVKFRLVYNKSQGKLKDMIQVIGQIGEEKAIVYSQSLEGLNKENENVVSGVVLSLWRTVNSIGNELLAYASTSAVNYTQVQNDLSDLIKAVKEELVAGNKVVLVGHSQGNLFVNAAYGYMMKNSGVWQTQTGIRLPDNTKLAVLGISVPSDHVADKTEIASRIGRQRYTTDCVDFVWTSFPGFLPYNVRGNSTNGLLNEVACDYHLVLNAVQEALGLLSPLSYFQKPDSLATVSSVRSANPNLISKLASIGKEWVTDKVFWGVLETGAPFRHHKLDNYLTRNSPTWKQITFDLVAVLPNLPSQTINQNCLYCERFTNVNPWWTYHWDMVPFESDNGVASLEYDALKLATSIKSMTYQTSQQFFGRISAKVEFTHQGLGESRIAITKGMNGPKVADLVIGSSADINAAKLSIYNASGGVIGAPMDMPISQFYSRKIFTAEIDSVEVRLYIDGTLQLKQPYFNISQSTSNPGGFYLQLASNSDPGVGTNILLVHKVEVTRLVSLPPTFTFSPSQSQATVEAGKSVDFAFNLKSVNGYSGKITVGSMGLPSGATAPSVYLSIPANQTVAGKFTVSTTAALKAGSYKFTAFAVGPALLIKSATQTLTVTSPVVVAPPVLTSVTVSPNPPTTGVVRITAVGTGITSATVMELTGPYCAPCVLSAKVSQTATTLVMDAELINPGTYTVKLRNGTLYTVGKDFTVTAPATSNTLNETFQTNYSTNWNMTIGSGSPLTAWEPGRLRVQASKSGASASFVSKQTFTGSSLSAEFNFAHYNYGRTSVWIMPASGDQRLAGIDLDTDDCNYLNFWVPTKSTEWKYAGSPYMNRKVVFKIAISGSQVQFYADGTLMETMSLSGTGPYRVAFAVGSITWKSGDNITDFYGVTVNAQGTTQPTPLALSSVTVSPNPPVTGVVRITAAGTGITSATSMEITGPYCAPCVLSAKVSQTATTLVMDAQLNNPGTFTVKLRDGTQLTAGKDFTVTAPTPTAGTVGVSVSGYSGSVSCNLNSVGITAPTTLSSKPAGSYSLACAAPSGYTITGITSSSTQTLSAGGTVNFTVNLTAIVVAPPPLANVSCSVSAASVQTGTQVVYTANWTGGSGSPGFNWSGYVSGTTRSISKTYTSPGTYSASVTVMDNGQQLTGQCSNVTVTAPPPALSVSWFSYFPDSPKTTDTITLSFNGTGFTSNTQVWVFGINCTGGCQAGVVASSITSGSMQALAQLRNVDNFQVKVRDGSSGTFILAGTVPVR